MRTRKQKLVIVCAPLDEAEIRALSSTQETNISKIDEIVPKGYKYQCIKIVGLADKSD